MVSDGAKHRPHHQHPILRALILVLIVGTLIALAMSATVHEALLGVLEASRSVIAAHPVAGPVIFALLAGISAMLSFVSSTVLIPAAVYAWGPVTTTILLWIGWMLGGIIAHSLAFYFGRPLLHWLAPPETLEKYEHLLSKHSSFGEILLFQLALPSELVGYGLGLARVSLGRYLAALAVAQVPYAAGTVLLGVGFVERDIPTLIGVSVAGVLGILVVARLMQKHTER